MSCLLSTLLSIIIFRLDFSIVILVNNIDVDLVSLLFQEVSGSDHFGQDIPHSENIGLSWALGVQFFFCIGNMINHWGYYLPCKVVVDGHPEVFVYLTPHDGHFCSISVLCNNASKNARNNFGINVRHLQVLNMPYYFALFIINNYVHNTLLIFVFLLAHLL